MKEDKKENGDEDVNAEDNEGEQPEKRTRLDETEEIDQSITELNGTETSETLDETVDDDIEMKVDLPVVDIANEDAKTEVETEEVNEISEPEPTKESAPVKTTPTRGRGGRGRGTATRRGRSSR